MPPKTDMSKLGRKVAKAIADVNIASSSAEEAQRGYTSCTTEDVASTLRTEKLVVVGALAKLMAQGYVYNTNATAQEIEGKLIRFLSLTPLGWKEIQRLERMGVFKP